MDPVAAYCTTRRDLEERGWFLTSRLSELTTKLMRMIGRDRQAFLDLREECRMTRRRITASHHDLREHRREHGC